MSDYIDGAVMAYRDCAELMRTFQKNVPPGPYLDPIKGLYMQCEVAFDMKADEAIRLAQEARAGK